MCSKSFLMKNPCLKMICVAIFGNLLAAPELRAKQLPSQARIQINQQAALLSRTPSKLSLTVGNQEISFGTKLPVQIALLNSDDQAVPTLEDWQCEVSFKLPSGSSTSQTVWIKKGESTAQLEFSADQAGLTSISVRAPGKDVRPDKTTVIVRPAKRPMQKKLSRVSSERRFEDGMIHRQFVPVRIDRRPARFELIAALSNDSQGSENQPPPSTSASVLHISVSDVGGNFVANGKDAAIISAVFESPDLSPAPADIHIWFSWTNGLLDPPQPIKIKKGSFSVKTRLTSTSPSDVAFHFVSSTPPYQAQGDTSFTIHFIPVGVALIGPDKLSVVDDAPVMVVFFDAHNNPISPGKNWPVTLRCKQSKLRFTPQSFEVQPTSPTGSAVLFPISFGSETIEAVVPGYNPPPLPIIITGWLVLGLCIAGGVAGGLAAYNKFKGSWL